MGLWQGLGFGLRLRLRGRGRGRGRGRVGGMVRGRGRVEHHAATALGVRRDGLLGRGRG